MPSTFIQLVKHEAQLIIELLLQFVVGERWYADGVLPVSIQAALQCH